MVAGRRAELGRLKEELENDGVRTSMLKVERAYHSPTMQSIVDDLQEATRSVRFRPPRIPLVSCTTGTLAHDEMLDGRYWVRAARPPGAVPGEHAFACSRSSRRHSSKSDLHRRCCVWDASAPGTGSERREMDSVPWNRGASDRETLAAGLAALTEGEGGRKPSSRRVWSFR